MALLEELITGQTSSLEKALLTLSAGAFGLSIAFVAQMVPDPKHLWAMILAWSAFGLSLIITVFSFYASIKALDREREITHAVFYPDFVPPPPNKNPESDEDGRFCDEEGSKDAEHPNRWGDAVDYLNRAAVISFAVGVVALGYFATVNVV